MFTDPCFSMNYSYYITSTYEFDSQKLELSFFDMLASMFSDQGPTALIENALNQKAFDHKLTKELGDSLSIACEYDELPKVLPVTEAGYDLTYRILVGMESSQEISIVAIEKSLFRVILHDKNPKNNINLFLYNSKHELIGQSEQDFDVKELLVRLGGDK